MRIKQHIVVVLLIGNLFAGLMQAQDPQFSQVFAAPLFLNSAFTGDTEQERLVLNYRKQWTGISYGYRSYTLSYDHNFKEKNAGIGFSLLQDEAGIQGLRLTEFATSFAKNLPFDRTSGMRIGLKVGIANRSFDRDKLLFWDQVLSGSEVPSLENNLIDNNINFDAGAGVLYYASRFWGGLNVAHLNRPDHSFLGQEEKLPMKFSLHAGAEFVLTKSGRNYIASSIKPVVNFKKQQDWQQLDVGAYWNKRALMLGLWYRGLPIGKKSEPNYRNNDALVLLAGISINRQYQIGYSYDLTISKLSVRSGGSHEISLIFEWPRMMKRNRKNYFIPCPKF